MSKISAKQIVAAMLEDFAPDDRAGGPKDAWRKGGFAKFTGKNFTGKRPNDTTPPVKDDEEETKPDASSPHQKKPKPRFKFPTESLLSKLTT